MWTQYTLLLFFNYARFCGPYQSGLVRRGLSCTFGIYMVQATSFRHSWTRPLRTRAFPLGLRDLDPPAHQKIRTENKIMEFVAWCAEQTLLCTKSTCLLLGFPEDLGGMPKKAPHHSGVFASFNFFTGSMRPAAVQAFFVSSDKPNTDVPWVS